MTMNRRDFFTATAGAASLSMIPPPCCVVDDGGQLCASIVASDARKLMAAIRRAESHIAIQTLRRVRRELLISKFVAGTNSPTCH